MNHNDCMTCVHKNVQFIDAPCNECSNAKQEADDKWEPDELAQSLIDLGRRNGLEEALALVDSDCIAELRAMVEAK